MLVTHPTQYAEHARELAAAFHVDLFETDQPPETAQAAQLALKPGHEPIAKAVFVHEIHDETTYIVALHELGHCLAPLGTMPLAKQGLTPDAVQFWDVTLAEEEAAWDWAQHYALEWTGPMQGVKDWAIKTYRDGRDKAIAERDRLAAWAKRHRVDVSPGAFLGKIGTHIHLD